MPEKTWRGGCLPPSLALSYEHCFSFNWFHSWRPFAKCNYARLSPSVCVQEEPSLSVFLFSIFISALIPPLCRPHAQQCPGPPEDTQAPNEEQGLSLGLSWLEDIFFSWGKLHTSVALCNHLHLSMIPAQACRHSKAIWEPRQEEIA